MVVNYDWSKYLISEREFYDNSFQFKSMTKLRHVAHLSDARQILKGKNIIPQLVYDQSLLRNFRLPVVWLSPNDWWYGPMYGTVSFEFSLELFWTPNGPSKFYWVEAVEHYKPTALRFLLTDNELDEELYSSLKEVKPDTFDQPLLLIDGEIHWRQNLCYEIMIDHSQNLDTVDRIFFENHNKTYCNKTRDRRARSCKETSRKDAQRQLLSLALALRPGLYSDYFDGSKGYFRSELVDDYTKFLFEDWLLPSMKRTDRSRSTSAYKEGLRMALICLGEGYEDTAQRFLVKLESFALIRDYLAARVEKHYGSKARSSFLMHANDILDYFSAQRDQEQS